MSKKQQAKSPEKRARKTCVGCDHLYTQHADRSYHCTHPETVKKHDGMYRIDNLKRRPSWCELASVNEEE